MKLLTIDHILAVWKRMIVFIYLLCISFFSGLAAYPFTNRPENCDTTGQNDSNTKAAVYGDSRMDYMGNIPGLPLYD
ncbi:MAG TPA: hypothetical protein PL048_10865, partial [Leptospiraceae bacterium]|nr:hypothetical protein [Leptospiraceae bacterium]